MVSVCYFMTYFSTQYDMHNSGSLTISYVSMHSSHHTHADAACSVSASSSSIGQHHTLYNFSCTDTCSYWVLYILHSSVSLGGRCSNLPCMLDTTSSLKDATIVYSRLNLVSKKWLTITTNETLALVAQCAYLASYKDPLVLRQGVMLWAMPLPTTSCAMPEPNTVPSDVRTTRSTFPVVSSASVVTESTASSRTTEVMDMQSTMFYPSPTVSYDNVQ